MQTPKTIPHPLHYPGACMGPRKRMYFDREEDIPESFICEKSGINKQVDDFLSFQTYESVNQQLHLLRRNTTAEVAFLIVDSYSSQYTMNDFAEGVFKKWGVGTKKDNNGVLIVISRDNRRMSIKTGKGTRKYFRKSTVNAARDNSLQYLKVQDYDAAVSYLANVFIYKLTHLPPWYVRFLWWFQDHIFITILIIVGILGVIVGLLMMLRRKRIQERQERFNAEMDTLRQRLENPSTAQAPIFSEHCPICMENFPPSHIQRMAQYSQAVENGEEEAFLRNTNWNEDTSVEILPKCGHQFHRECISLWLRRENSCPICRTEDPRSPPGVSPHSHRHNDDNERENRGRRRPDSRRPGPGFDCEEPSHSQRTRSRMMQGLDVLDFVIRPAPVTLSDVFVMRDRQRYTRVIGSAQRSERQFMESIRQMMQEVVSEQSDREHSDRGRSSFGGGSSEGGYSSEGSW